jgi:peptidoglycan/LPS O-acetylase OafA/YrhL
MYTDEKQELILAIPVPTIAVAPTTQKPTSGSETRLLELDGLRGVAILMVLVCHYGFAPYIGQAAAVSFQVFGFQIFSTGVDLFFVLSGFLIGGILIDHRTSPKYFRTFYGRRIVRIFPVYYGFLLLTAVAGVIQHIHGKPTPVFDAGTPYWMFPLFLQNFSLAWFGDWNWITVTMAWSLALEEQCYLTLPAAVKMLNTKTVVALSALLVLGAPVLRYFVSSTPHSVGVLVLAAIRSDGLAAGLLCAVLVRSGFKVSTRLLGAAALFFGVMVVVAHLGNSPAEFLRGTTLAVFYSCILLLATRGRFAILRSPILRFFGTISYALYLVHQSALVLLQTVMRHAVPSATRGGAILLPLAALLLSIAVCWWSWLYFERPLMSWARGRFRY